MLFETSNISIDPLINASLIKKDISLSVLRLDKIHPVICGNKLFKLHFFLAEAIDKALPGLLTFGGAYSNHLMATAYACKITGLKSIGLVRGEKPAILSPTLLACMEYGMELIFISRAAYALKDADNFLATLNIDCVNFLLVPEGGYHPKGAMGAALIMDLVAPDTTHICTATGTATTLAGLIEGAKKHQHIIGIPVLKGMTDIPDRISYLTNSTHPFHLLEGYQFGGYAKKTPALLQFMNEVYVQYKLPTDFVYTAKMLFAIFNSIEKDYFAPGSKITCLHTGGLQGNQSLPKGSLVF